MKYNIKTKQQIINIKESGKYLNELILLIKDNVKSGIILIELENIAEKFINKYGLKGAFKGYKGFPANLCLSVNDCVVHGIPDKYQLKDGDILKIDCGINYKGGISDAAISVIVGGDSKNILGSNLIKSTKNSLDKCLNLLQPNKTIYDFSTEVYKSIKKDGFEVIKYLTGHGVGNDVHEKPYIYNFPFEEGKKIKLLSGMVVALEPITSIKSDDFIQMKGNSWNLCTEKGDIGAQWEYTVLIKEGENEILAGIN